MVEWPQLILHFLAEIALLEDRGYIGYFFQWVARLKNEIILADVFQVLLGEGQLVVFRNIINVNNKLSSPHGNSSLFFSLRLPQAHIVHVPFNYLDNVSAVTSQHFMIAIGFF